MYVSAEIHIGNLLNQVTFVARLPMLGDIVLIHEISSVCGKRENKPTSKAINAYVCYRHYDQYLLELNTMACQQIPFCLFSTAPRNMYSLKHKFSGRNLIQRNLNTPY